MKARVELPYGYGRAFYDNTGRFEKAAPEFNVNVFDDEGVQITDPYPSKVMFGPDMYNLMNVILPGIAARRNEDLTYEGVVNKRPRVFPDEFAYYGIGKNPLTGVENYGVGLIGFGDTEVPKHSFGVDYAGRDNFLYSKKIKDAYTEDASDYKSKLLTNILNDSQDFSMLFGPKYKFTDLDYDPKNDPEGKGPRPTDNWVPVYLPEVGGILHRRDSKKTFIPIPLTQNLPIYNFAHPMWQQNPEAAWTMLDDPNMLLNWKQWGIAPTYSDVYGNTTKTKTKGVIKPLNYLLQNLKMAARKGYFEDYPDIKEGAEDRYKDLKREYFWNRVNDAREEQVKEWQKEQEDKKIADDKAAATEAKRHGSNRKAIKDDLRFFLKKNEELAAAQGISKEDLPAALEVYLANPDMFDAIDDKETRILMIFQALKNKRG